MAPTPTGPAVYRATDAWSNGDLAESLNDTWLFRGSTPTEGPPKGDVHKVIALGSEPNPIWGPVEWLAFSRWPGTRFAAGLFRKVTPRADQAERANLAFIDLLKQAPHRIPALEPRESENV